MTNYFHFIPAGHFSFYLITYGSLYKCQQQGFEQVNGRTRRSYQHNTNKGGRKGGSSKLLAIFSHSVGKFFGNFVIVMSFSK